MFLDAEDGKMHYEWGNYFSDETKALVDYISRAADYERRDKVKAIALPITTNLDAPAIAEPLAVKALISFIDSEYREQFQIPDGESIRIIYPADDGREPAERECKYEGETHVSIGSSFYHIAEFAQAMERVGAKAEPVTQIPIHGMEFDFGSNYEGDHFNSSWNERDNGLFNGDIQSELQAVVYALRQDLLKDRDSLIAYCQDRPDAITSSGDNHAIYGFKLETESRQYFVSCFVSDVARDSSFSVYAYADKPALGLSQDRQATQETGDALRGLQSKATKQTLEQGSGEKPSVLDEIKASRDKSSHSQARAASKSKDWEVQKAKRDKRGHDL